MSSNGGAPYGSDEPTSFGLQPPRPSAPYPGNPYAQPAESAPAHASPAQAAPQAPVPAPPAAPPHAAPSHAAPPHAKPSHPAHPHADPAQMEPRPPRQDPGAGRLIAGRYRLLAKLGHGGMGTVWRAKDETVDREVAVKEPRVPDHLPDRERSKAFERMRREARAAARLDHPAVVNVHDVAVVDGQPWIVMELVQGRSLGAVLQEGTLGVRDAAKIGLEVLGALEAAHAAGILHRDVKPDNVLLGRHDRVVLTDFGIAQIEGETNLTDTGSFVGSPEYIAPERVLGQRPGPASDLWSLGVVLYAATEGVSPFRRTNTPATLQSVLNSTPAAPASAQGPLAEVINGLLNKDSARRPTADRVRALLEEAARPPAPEPTQVVQLSGPGGTGVRIGRTTLFGLGGAVVAAAVAACLVIADPFAGPLPDGWKTRAQTKLGVTLGVPADYQETKPDADDTDKNWVTYSDYSGSIWIGLNVARKSQDSLNQIKNSAPAQMYADDEKFKNDGSYELSMPEGVRTTTDDKATYQGKQAAENTIAYTTTDTQNPRPRELKIFYYRTKAGDMYKLTISYPGKGDFTDRGREVARTAIANLEIDER
ncbi:serine/threonine-protein kinase [Streptomyces bluensis]|uniref:serine/threonine-protein kinase n=1 Tax=Streptomyces bluensis TaxID=33897 RepID=UPI00167A053E|nr:serine/threonine-protein kinase [Streptomyces bluensis]GGZ57788.1 protein kinase [Streptomyces bluensis]